ncbi:MAG: LLM class flavin-dependent oxidoreductase [Chloroflexota bacterium]|nr:LLM class flavin-dependent oxidoreductase [Chloroflexota bacterium]
MNASSHASTPRFGIVRNQNIAWESLRRHWRVFEELGFDSLWHADHYQRPSVPDDPFLEGWTLLAAMANATSRIRLGILVTSNTFRNPALVAKQAVTVDHISAGRLELGLGTGWFEPEHAHYGVPFPPPGELVGRFREAVTLVDRLLRENQVTFAGEYYRLDGALFQPPAVQQPRPPLTLGAHGPKMLAIVAQFADRWNSYGTVEEIWDRNAMLDELCVKAGRDPGSIIRSLYGWTLKLGADPWESPAAFAEIVGHYRDAGINEFLMEAPHEEQFPMMERIARDLLPELRRSG